MRKLLTLLALFTLLALPVNADQARFRAIISAQIEAFRADDFKTAFGFASPSIQSRFQTPQRFGAMVRQGYPMVWRPREVEFLSVQTRNGAPWQQVLIRDGEGALHLLEYNMVEVDGGWKINAVRVVKAPGGMA